MYISNSISGCLLANKYCTGVYLLHENYMSALLNLLTLAKPSSEGISLKHDDVTNQNKPSALCI